MSKETIKAMTQAADLILTGDTVDRVKAIALLQDTAKREEAQSVGPVAWDAILGAVACGWTTPENEHKTMDHLLAIAIGREVEKLLRRPAPSKQPAKVGDSKFESWYSEVTHSSEVKQGMREAYEAGMNDPMATKQVTCQIYGHVVGACVECNTHSEATDPTNLPENCGSGHCSCIECLKPAKPSVGERDGLLSDCNLYVKVGVHIQARDLVKRCADMLAADALEIAGWREDQKENLSNQVELQRHLNDLKVQQVAVPQGWISRPTYPNENDKWQYSEVKPQSKRNSVEFDVVEVFAAPQPPQGDVK